MQFQFDNNELRPLIENVVETTLARVEASRPDSRLAYTESEAASLLGIPRHVLRDARLRGEIRASLVGKRLLYTTESLRQFLAEREV